MADGAREGASETPCNAELGRKGMCARTAHPGRLFLSLVFASLLLSSCGGQPPPDDPTLGANEGSKAKANHNRLTIALVGRYSPGVASLVVSLTSV